MDKTIEERAKEYACRMPKIGTFTMVQDIALHYSDGATEQKAIDDVRIKKLEEALKAYKAFCHNIINEVFIDNEKAAIEQLQYIKANFSKDVNWDSL